MPRDRNAEVKQHVSDKVAACARCAVKLAKDVRKEADIAPALARLEAQEPRINSTQKMLYRLPNVAMELEDELNAAGSASADLAAYLGKAAGPAPAHEEQQRQQQLARPSPQPTQQQRTPTRRRSAAAAEAAAKA